MNDIDYFLEQYKKLTDIELLYILSNPTDYQALAVNAARLEFDSRNLSQDEIKAAYIEVGKKLSNKRILEQKSKVLNSKIVAFRTSIADTLNPIQREPLTTARYIQTISFSLFAIFLYEFFGHFRLLKLMIASIISIDFAGTIYVLTLIIPFLAAILFWFKKKSGWLLATIYFSYGLIDSIMEVYFGIKRIIRAHGYKDSLTNNYFQIPSPTTFLVAVLIFASALLIICKPTIREVYKISKKTMYVVLGAVTFLSFLLYVLL